MTATVSTAPSDAAPTSAPVGRRRLPRRPRNLGFALVFVIVAVIVLLPLYRLQSLALENGGEGYRTAFSRDDVGTLIVNTVLLGLGSLVIALVCGTALAWASTRLSPRMRLLRTLPLIPIVVPPVAAVIGWVFLLSPGPGYLNVLMRQLPWWNHLQEGPVDIYSRPWIIIITGFMLTSFVYMFVSSGFRNVSRDMQEAARTSGSSGAGVLFRVTLPLLRPVLVYGGAVALLIGLGQFTAPLLLGRNLGIDVVTTQMYFFVAESPVDYAASAAFGSPLLVFGILVVIAQKVLIGDQNRFVTHGGKGFVADPRPSKLAPIIIGVYGVVAVVLPVAALAVLSLSPFWSASIGDGGFSLDNFRVVLENPKTIAGITNSLVLSLGAAVVALPLGYVVALILVRTGPRFRLARQAIDFMVAMPLGVPGVVYGLGFLLAYGLSPFYLYATKSIIVIAYVTLMLPFATRMLLSGMVSIGMTYQEASRVSGAGVIRTNANILLPLLRPTFLGAFILIFIMLTHEFSASLFVRAANTNVMGTLLYDMYGLGSYPLVAAVALIMTVITAIGVALAFLVGGSDALDKM